MSECVFVFGSVFGPGCWFVCVYEPAASAWPGAEEMEWCLLLDDYRGGGSCSGTEAQLHYWRLSVQEDGSPDAKQVDSVGAADSHQGVSKLALWEVVAGGEL